MIKRIAFVFGLSVLLTGCFAKKRTTYNKRQKKETQAIVKNDENTFKEKKDGLYPMPDDTGKFVKFPISSVKEYIATFSEIAQFEMKAYGIPASITLAQGILESGAGRGELALKTNNHFGIKCHAGWDGEFEYHDDDAKGECFRKYNHPMYSFRDHSIFLSSRSRYAFLFDYRSDDYKRWAKGLREAGYATDKRYPQKLIALIEAHNLTQYDQQVVSQGYEVEKEPKTYDFGTYVVQKGDTLYSISRRYFVSVNELKRLNKMRGDTLSIGQKLIVKTEKLNK
ncbi:glucosaminidase domain-containing protein [Costertonia aggregata]|uniref:Peptidoglycan hydrolase n=1 Tax=Costertonia aggregata TaxID=343403 RepID=A0A7H9AR32_9FLAO|nr:glucosaminidase domain-containing protein [Costertonia aggregata]QLG45890.1 glucosaminidase domain-containing protein [Costertonia aggregata]